MKQMQYIQHILSWIYSVLRLSSSQMIANACIPDSNQRVAAAPADIICRVAFVDTVHGFGTVEDSGFCSLLVAGVYRQLLTSRTEILSPVTS